LAKRHVDSIFTFNTHSEDAKAGSASGGVPDRPKLLISRGRPFGRGPQRPEA
jgi:hypothetical protein